MPSKTKHRRQISRFVRYPRQAAGLAADGCCGACARKGYAVPEGTEITSTELGVPTGVFAGTGLPLYQILDEFGDSVLLCVRCDMYPPDTPPYEDYDGISGNDIGEIICL